MIATIERVYKENCTIGVFKYDILTCKTLELPWLNNKVSISCIPEGVYDCKKIVSPSLGECFEISDVKGRTYIRIHAGNYTSQIQGCVLVGKSHADINGDGITDVTSSRKTLSELLELMPDSFKLEIKSEA